MFADAEKGPRARGPSRAELEQWAQRLRCSAGGFLLSLICLSWAAACRRFHEEVHAAAEAEDPDDSAKLLNGWHRGVRPTRRRTPERHP